MSRRSASRRPDRRLVWVLSTALLAQLLLPVQAHTAWQTSPAGRVVMICTLQGIQPLALDTEQALAQNAAHSPAVQFSLLLAAAVPRCEAALAPARLLVRLLPVDRNAVCLAKAPLPRCSIRAPPTG